MFLHDLSLTRVEVGLTTGILVATLALVIREKTSYSRSKTASRLLLGSNRRRSPDCRRVRHRRSCARPEGRSWPILSGGADRRTHRTRLEPSRSCSLQGLLLVILEQTRKRPTNQTAHSGSQLHFELVASTKLFTELSAFDAALVTVRI